MTEKSSAKRSAADIEAHEMLVKQMQDAGSAALELACSQGLMRLLGHELSIPAIKEGDPPIPCMFSWTHGMLAMYQLAGQAVSAVRNDVIGRAVKEARKKRDGKMLLAVLDLRTTLWLGQHELTRSISLDNMAPAIEALNVLDGEMQAHVDALREVAIVKSRWHQTWRQRAEKAKIANLPWWLTEQMKVQLPPRPEPEMPVFPVGTPSQSDQPPSPESPLPETTSPSPAAPAAAPQ